MGDALGRLREPLGRPYAVGALPEESQIALAVGLEDDTPAVERPDRESMCPPNVSFRGDPPAARSYTQMLVSRASLEPKAIWRPSGDMRGSEYGPAGTGTFSTLPARSKSASVISADPPVLTGPGKYTKVPESDMAYQEL